MEERLKTENLVDLKKTIAAALFGGKIYAWEVLADISGFILALGETLPADKFERRADNVWVAKSANVYPSALINGPCIIDEGAEIRHCAFIRGNAVIGKNAVVGNSTEIKNAVLFDNVQVPHYNYVGDSVLGYKAHMGAGSIISNVKLDKAPVIVRFAEGEIETGLKKFGAVIGDNVEIGCNAVINPGTVIGRGAVVYPLASVGRVVGENQVVKSNGTITGKK